MILLPRPVFPLGETHVRRAPIMSLLVVLCHRPHPWTCGAGFRFNSHFGIRSRGFQEMGWRGGV